eukprot:scaffold5960_cov63-Phaeocystis_antarctica.AAC.3
MGERCHEEPQHRDLGRAAVAEHLVHQLDRRVVGRVHHRHRAEQHAPTAGRGCVGSGGIAYGCVGRGCVGFNR